MRKITLTLAVIAMAGMEGFAQTNVQDAAAAAAAALAAAPEAQAEAPKPQYWQKESTVTLGLTNTQLHNWAAGGYNTVTLNTGLDAKADYAKDLMSWNNRLQLNYGFLYSSDKPILQKSTDQIYLESKWAYKTGEKSHFSYTASFNFRSQFANGYKYNNPAVEEPTRKDWRESRLLQSGFISPAYTDLALGLQWQPKDWFTVNFAPLTGGFTIVSDQDLRAKYSMPLKPEYEDKAAADITPDMYKFSRFELGAQLKVDFKASINKVINYETQLVLFSDYLHKPKNMRVNWDNKLTWQMAKYFNVGFQTWLIYDPLVVIDGTQKTQFKEYLSINFTYTFK